MMMKKLYYNYSEYNNNNTNVRYLITLMLCLSNTLCYICRMNISIAIPNFINDQGDRGIVLSSFFYGYICTQILAGYMSSKIGVKFVLLIGIIVWTIFDFCTIFVYNNESLLMLVLVRALMGCGEGVVMSSLHIFASNWYPISEQTTLVAITSSGSDLGTILSLLISPYIIQITNGKWQYIYVVFTIVTIIYLIFYVRNVTSKPEQHPYISSNEKDMIVSTRQQQQQQQQQQSTATKKTHHKKKIIPWRILLTNRYLWIIYISHFCANYSWYVLLGWLPTYVHEHLGLNLLSKENNNQIYAATPYICGYIGLLSAGKLSDYLITKTKFRTLHVRKFMNCVGSFIPAILLYTLPYCNTPITAIYILSGSLFFGRACTSGFWINMIDIGSDHVGPIMGISNTIATIPGIFGNIITGYILKSTHNNWTVVFHVAAFICAIGGIVFGLGSTDRNIFMKRPKIEEEEDNDDDDDAVNNNDDEVDVYDVHDDEKEREPFLSKVRL